MKNSEPPPDPNLVLVVLVLGGVLVGAFVTLVRIVFRL
jgi:LPS O-antigen subunit length determinant protein (WzzB/FepE family)